MAKLADVVAVLQEQNKTLGSVEANLSKILAEDVARKKKDASFIERQNSFRYWCLAKLLSVHCVVHKYSSVPT